MTVVRMLTAGVLALSVSSAAGAATLDFSGLTPGAQGSTVLILPEATITSFGDDIFVGAAGIASEICAFNSGPYNCEADLEVDFNSLVSNLNFDVSGYDAGDLVTATAYDALDNVIGSFNISANGSYGFGALADISRVFFDDQSSGAGMAYDNFEFSPVPLPAALPLLIGALGAMGFATRRRKA